jgi:hypothetical protein
MMNYTFSIKSAVNIVSTRNFCILTFKSFFEPYMIYKHICSGHSSRYDLFNISNVSVAVFLNFVQNLSLPFVPFWNIQYDEKTNFTKTAVIICINETSWNLHII